MAWRSAAQRKAAFASMRRRDEGLRLSPHTKIRGAPRAPLPPKVRTDQFMRVNNDVNGNPRYAIHFMNFVTDAERRKHAGDPSTLYALALQRARPMGGKKFHTKQYGGGIVFQSYSLPDTTRFVNKKLQRMAGAPGAPRRIKRGVEGVREDKPSPPRMYKPVVRTVYGSGDRKYVIINKRKKFLEHPEQTVKGMGKEVVTVYTDYPKAREY